MIESSFELSPNVQNLIATWKYHKEQEDQAKKDRLEVEKRILYGMDITIKPKGTTTIQDIKISTREEIKVDVEIATELQIPSKLNPFRIKAMSCDKNKLDHLKQSFPDIYAQVIPAITTVLCKPSFTLSRKSARHASED